MFPPMISWCSIIIRDLKEETNVIIRKIFKCLHTLQTNKIIKITTIENVFSIKKFYSLYMWGSDRLIAHPWD